ncbi:MAG: acetyltransferase [Verrucomicrobiota bacterium]
MKDLFILGAGGFGREVLGWLKDLPDYNVKWKVAGFLDDNKKALDRFDIPYKVECTLTDWSPKTDALYVCALGKPEVKQRICRQMLESGATFISLIHPSSIIGDRVTLGQGVVICPRVTLTCDVKVGDFAMINCHSSAGHDSSVGSWATISAHCDLTGGTRVGDSAFLGSGVSIIPSKSVGKNAVVGAGSVVIRSVPDGVKVFGNPARQFS